MGKIKKTKVPKNNPLGIKQTELGPPSGLSFSFKYLYDNHDKFRCDGQDALYWQTLINRLKALSTLTAQDLRGNRSSTLRCHPIDWKSSSVSENCFGLPNEEQLVDTPYQFSLSSNAHGRVHGFFIEEIFYVVWLDPDHLLYPGT